MITEFEKQEGPVDIIIDLDVTSPLRDIEDIINCFQLLTSDVDLVITGYRAKKNPYFNMVEPNEAGFVSCQKLAERYFPVDN